jgi:hypothetical protein
VVIIPDPLRSSMNTTTILGLSALAAIGLYFVRLKGTVSNLNFYVYGAGLTFDGIVPVLHLDVAIQNPDENSFVIKSIAGQLSSNGYPIGNVSAFTQATVPPLGQIVYPIYIRLSLISIVSDIVHVFTGGGVQQKVEFNGTTRIDNLTAPLSFEYTIG